MNEFEHRAYAAADRQTAWVMTKHLTNHYIGYQLFILSQPHVQAAEHCIQSPHTNASFTRYIAPTEQQDPTQLSQCQLPSATSRDEHVHVQLNCLVSLSCKFEQGMYTVHTRMARS